MIQIHIHDSPDNGEEIQRLKDELIDARDVIWQHTNTNAQRLSEIEKLAKARDEAVKGNKELLEKLTYLQGQIDQKQFPELNALQEKMNRYVEGMNIRIKDRDATIAKQHEEIKELRGTVSSFEKTQRQLEDAVEAAQVQEKEAKKHVTKLMNQLKTKKIKK